MGKAIAHAQIYFATKVPPFVHFENIKMNYCGGLRVKPRTEELLRPLNLALNGSKLQIRHKHDLSCFNDHSILLDLIANESIPISNVCCNYEFVLDISCDFDFGNFIGKILQFDSIKRSNDVLFDCDYHISRRIELPIQAIVNWLNCNPDESGATGRNTGNRREKDDKRYLKITIRSSVKNIYKNVLTMLDRVEKVILDLFIFFAQRQTSFKYWLTSTQNLVRCLLSFKKLTDSFLRKDKNWNQP